MWADGPCHDDTVAKRFAAVYGSPFLPSPLFSFAFPFSVVRFTFFLFIFSPHFLFRFSVFAYGHLQGGPAGPAVMLQIPWIPDPHSSNHPLFPYVACPTRVREIAGNEADAAQYIL